MIDLAYAQGAGGLGQGGMWTFLLPMVLMFAIFYFLLLRPQQRKAKEHKAFLENLKKGDRVVTSGGLYGEIVGFSEQAVMLEVADRVRVKVGRPYIAGFAPKEG